MAARLVDVRRDELVAVVLSFVYFFALLCSWSILKPLRDEMGLAGGGVDKLSWTFTATFLAMLAAVPAFSALAARVRRARMVPLVYLFFLSNLLAFFFLLTYEVAPVALARVFYVWASVFNLFVVSVFWSFMTDLYTPSQGRRLFACIAAGGSAGAVVGSQITAWVVRPLGTTNLILVSAGVLALCLPCIAWLARWGGERLQGTTTRPVGGGILAGIAHVFRSPYLAALCAQTLLYTATSTMLYTQRLRIVSTSIADPRARTQLFANLETVVNVATIAVQLIATGRIIAWTGIGTALAVVPIVTALGFLVLAGQPSLWSQGPATTGMALLWFLVAFEVARRVAHYAVDRPAREVLFTALSREDKYKAKSFIDTVIYRGGDAASGWAVDGIRGAGLAVGGVAAVAAPLAALWLWLTRYLARGYAERVTRVTTTTEDGEATMKG